MCWWGGGDLGDLRGAVAVYSLQSILLPSLKCACTTEVTEPFYRWAGNINHKGNWRSNFSFYKIMIKSNYRDTFMTQQSPPSGCQVLQPRAVAHPPVSMLIILNGGYFSWGANFCYFRGRLSNHENYHHKKLMTHTKCTYNLWRWAWLIAWPMPRLSEIHDRIVTMSVVLSAS